MDSETTVLMSKSASRIGVASSSSTDPMVPNEPASGKMFVRAASAQAGAGSKRSFSTRGGTRVGY